MAARVATCEPTDVTAGDTWQWIVNDTDYPSSLFALAYVIAGVDKLVLDATSCVPQPDNSFLVTATKSVTMLSAGIYRFVRTFSDSTTRISQDLQPLTVAADPATLAAGDAQPKQEVLLAYIEAALEGRYLDGMAGYMIGGKQVQYVAPEALRAERAALRAELAALRTGGRDPLGTVVPIAIRFAT